MAKKIMIQGTSSGAGKSIVATALCRIFTTDGYAVAPFKPQNMALNSFVTTEGLEIGRAQVVQAEAAKKIPTVHMNPILLKPTGNNLSQVIVRGKAIANMDSDTYKQKKLELLPVIEESFRLLAEQNDIIVIEGAGSPAELNMMETDISNMKSAERLEAPVLLVADIDRGGVFASIYGTVMLQSEGNRARIKGILINKFKGRKQLLAEGIERIERLTGIPVLGILPYERIALEDEDSISEKRFWDAGAAEDILIEVVRHPHLSNATDLEALRHIDGVTVRYVEPTGAFSTPDLIVIPGTKNTIADLRTLKNSKLSRQLIELHKHKNTPIIGICGGFQMLGKTIRDPHHLEDTVDEISGFGLLEHETIFEHEKVTTQAKATVQRIELPTDSPFSGMAGIELVGYEVHSGRTPVDTERSIVFTRLTEVLGEQKDQTDGILNPQADVMGTYLHGLFDNADFTTALINNLRRKKGLAASQSLFSYEEFKEKEFQKLEKLFRENIDIEKIYELLG